MRAQLGFCRETGQCGNRGQLSLLETEDITTEDVAEKMFLQKRVDNGRKFKDSSAGRSADDSSLIRRAESADVRIVGQRGGLSAHFVLDPPRLSFVKQSDEGVQTRQTAGKPRIGLHLDKNFLDFIDRHAVLQAFRKSAFQFFRIAFCGKCRYGDDALLFAAQCRYGVRTFGMCHR